MNAVTTFEQVKQMLPKSDTLLERLSRNLLCTRSKSPLRTGDANRLPTKPIRVLLSEIVSFMAFRHLSSNGKRTYSTKSIRCSIGGCPVQANALIADQRFGPNFRDRILLRSRRGSVLDLGEYSSA